MGPRGVVAAVLALSMLAPVRSATAADKLPLETFACGDLVTRSVRLADDVGTFASPCDEHGLVVDEAGITLDLNGHRIFGNATDDIGATESGVLIDDRSKVTVKNGAIRGFERGILSGNIFGGTRIKKVHVANNAVGILVTEPKDSVVTDSVATYNTDDGIRVTSDDATLARNTSTRNLEEGIVTDGDRTRIVSNVLAGNLGTGIRATGDDSKVAKNVVTGGSLGIRIDGERATVSRNIATGTTSEGIAITGADAVLRANLTVDNGTDGIEIDGTDSRVSANRSIGNVGDGIDINGGGFVVGGQDEADGNVLNSNEAGLNTQGNGRILGNRATNNDDSGILTFGTGSVEISRNRAIANGFQTVDGSDPGIDAEDTDLVTGGGNFAEANDHPDECFPAEICRGVRVTADLPFGFPECGDTITTSMRLGEDIGTEGSPCPSEGLKIEGDGVVLDLNGHTLWGNGVVAGLGLEIEGNGVVIANGRLRDFTGGVDADGVSDLTVDGLVIADSYDDDGLHLDGTKANISNTTVVNSSFAGISLGFSDDVKLIDVVSRNNDEGGIFGGDVSGARVTVSHNGGNGLSLGGTGRTVKEVVGVLNGFSIGVSGGVTLDGAVVARNGGGGSVAGIRAASDDTIVRNSLVTGNYAGVSTVGAGDVTFEHNVVLDSTTVGLDTEVSGATPSFRLNLVAGNGANGASLDSASVTLKANRFIGNSDDGVESSADTLRVAKNRFLGNGRNGLEVTAGSAEVNGNIAHANGYLAPNGSGLGLEAPGATGGDNQALGNDDADECDPAGLC